MKPVLELHLRIRLRAGEREAFFSFLKEAIPFYERHGDSRIRLLQSSDDPLCFIEIVEYASQEAYERGEYEVENDPEMQSYLQRWRALLAEPPVVELWNVQDNVINPAGGD